MNNDNQIKHHLYWILKTIGETGTYADFIKYELSEDVCREIDELVAYIKLNY